MTTADLDAIFTDLPEEATPAELIRMADSLERLSPILARDLRVLATGGDGDE